jgi:iron uptake system component EfeO
MTGLLAMGALATGLAGCASPSQPGQVITVSARACGADWGPAAPGWQTFQVRNSLPGAAEVDLVNPATGAIYAEVAALGPGTTRPMRLDLGSGRYAFRCLTGDTGSVTGPAVRIGGHRPGAAAILPVTTDDLLGPAREYHAYVTAGLNTLAGQVGQLAALIHAGQLAAARAAWLPAHLTYERLGGAYGTFGNYATGIDGRPDGLPGGVRDPGFTGFYRIEYGLWHGQSAGELAGPADTLEQKVRALRTFWPSMQISWPDFGLRSQQILENAAVFQLTGHDDFGSGTTLATTDANITGTRELLSVLHPLLVPRYPELTAADSWLARLHRLLAAQQRNGTWTPVAALAAGQRQQIDAAAGQAVEELAPIAAIFEPRRT